MKEGGIGKLIGDYFKDDISQFSVSILGSDMTYRGKAYCWSSCNELVFFNADLKHLQTVSKSAITKIDVDEISNECLLNTEDLRIKLKKASF
jgi:hypothetical protein